MLNSFLHTEQKKSNFKIPVFASLTFQNCSVPEILHLLHLLSNTDFCNFSEVQITRGDWFIHKCFLVSCSGSWSLSWKKPSTLRIISWSSSISFGSSEDLNGVLSQKWSQGDVELRKSLEVVLRRPCHRSHIPAPRLLQFSPKRMECSFLLPQTFSQSELPLSMYFLSTVLHQKS